MSSTPQPKLRRVLETCLYVDDLVAAESFYSRVLRLDFYSKQEGRHVFFRCGRQMVLLFNPQESARPASHSGLDVPTHGAAGPGHVCFAVAEDELPLWQAHLSQHGIAIERIIDWPDGGRSLYFRDPAGNSLELASPHIWGIDELSGDPF